MKKITGLFGVLVLMSLVLAACGGSSGGSGGGSSNAIDVTMTDFAFTPNSWTVTANTEVTLNIKNDGSVSHTWVLMSKAVTPPFSDANKADVIYTSPEIQPGQSQTVTFTAPGTAGDYEVVCDIPGHLEAGMEGKLTVK